MLSRLRPGDFVEFVCQLLSRIGREVEESDVWVLDSRTELTEPSSVGQLEDRG